MSEKKNHGQNEDLETVESEIEVEAPTGPKERPDLHNLITTQTNAILMLTGKLAEMTTKVESLEAHQDQSDAAIIEVAKKIGGGGGEGGGKGANLLAQILPYLTQQRGQSPIEKMAMKGFMENLAFSTLTTRKIARKQFGDEYTSMVKEMEAELAGKEDKGA